MIRKRRLVTIALITMLPVTSLACGGDEKDETRDDSKAGTTSSKPIETTQTLRAATPGEAPPKTKKPPKPTNSVEVKGGDTVSLVTTVPEQKLPKGAKLKITLSKGPGRKLKTSAGGAGGDPTSTGTIRAGGGGDISIEVVRYSCALPPTPTFCPIESKSTADGWELLMEPPKEGPVALSMVVK